MLNFSAVVDLTEKLCYNKTKKEIDMKRTTLRLLALIITVALTVLSLTGCTFFENIGKAFLGIFDGDLTDSDDAEFSLDEAINEITTSVMCSEVTVITEYYNKNPWGTVTDSATSQGSGTVIMRSTASDMCYVLTNAHCIEDMSEYTYKTVSVIDYHGNTHTNAEVRYSSISSEYDLAIVQFYCSDKDITPLPLAKQNPRIGETVIALGSPYSQMNSITVGEATSYYTGNLIDVEALYHTAPLGSGGSGGALLNTDLELCGVNFAADTTEGDFGNGSAIPIEAVREYLSQFTIFNLIL